jgi:transcriptional regulator with XRE-family HTH domain
MEKQRKLTGGERFKAMLDRAEQRESFHVDGAKLELCEQIYVAMEENGVSEAELSRRLGVSRAYVNKILQGSANLTIESLVKIGRALGREFRFEFLEPRKRVAASDQNGFAKTVPRPRRTKSAKIPKVKVPA